MSSTSALLLLVDSSSTGRHSRAATSQNVTHRRSRRCHRTVVVLSAGRAQQQVQRSGELGYRGSAGKVGEISWGGGSRCFELTIFLLLQLWLQKDALDWLRHEQQLQYKVVENKLTLTLTPGAQKLGCFKDQESELESLDLARVRVEVRTGYALSESLYKWSYSLRFDFNKFDCISVTNLMYEAEFYR